MKKSKAKVTRSIRFDADDLKKAEKLGIDISGLCRGILKHAIMIENKKATLKE